VSDIDLVDLVAALGRLGDGQWTADGLRQLADRLSRLADELDDTAYRLDRDAPAGRKTCPGPDGDECNALPGEWACDRCPVFGPIFDEG
jgi:hypothetical protein